MINKKGTGKLKINLAKFITILGLAYTVSLTPAYSQQIITDGYTATNLNVKGNVTDVTTNTVKGQNAFNSFKQFDVNKGNTVNLVVPDLANNLINLVKDKTSNIDGTLNSVRKGAVGGNVYLINPHGVVVGSEGRINVGSLTTVTPTKEYVDKFFDSANNPNEGAVKALLEGTAPINKEASVVNSGVITAENAIKVQAGNVVNNGTVALSDLVNTGELKEGSKVEIVAEGNITLSEGSLVKAEGREVYIYANNDTYFKPTAVVDVSSVNNDAGHIELSAKNFVEVAGTFKADSEYGKAGSVLVDPHTAVVSTSQYSNGAGILIQADQSISVLNNVVLSSRNTVGGATANQLTGLSAGNSGDIRLQSNNVFLGNNTLLLAHASPGFQGGGIFIDAMAQGGQVQLGGTIVSNNQVQINSGGSIFNTSVSGNQRIVSNNVILNANTGHIGADGRYITVDPYNAVENILFPLIDNIPHNGEVPPLHPDVPFVNGNVDPIINATAMGHIFLSSNYDLNIGQVRSIGPGDVHLAINSNFVDPFFFFINPQVPPPLPIGNGLVNLSNNFENATENFPIPTPFPVDDQNSIFAAVNGNVVNLEGRNLFIHGLSGNDTVENVGTMARSLRGNFTGNVNVNASGPVYLNPDVMGTTTVFSTSGPVRLAGNMVGNVSVQSGDGILVNQTTGNLNVGRIATPFGTVALVAAGNITDGLNNETPNVRGTDIYLLAYNGPVGTAANDLNIDLLGGALTAQSSGFINIHELNGNMLVNRVTNNGASDIILTSGGSIINGNPVYGDPNVIGRSITLFAPTNSIGTFDRRLVIDSNANTIGGNVNAQAKGLIHLYEPNGDLLVGTITNAGNSDVRLFAGGSILDGKLDETANINSNGLYLFAAAGTIGTLGDDLDIDTDSNNTGSVDTNFLPLNGIESFFSNGLIHVHELNGNLHLGEVSNLGKGDVIITSHGSIQDALPGELANIYARNITLLSQIGSIGHANDDLDVISGYTTGNGLLNAKSPGSIWLTQSTGNVKVGLVQSTAGNVNLFAQGSILDGTPDEGPNVVGQRVHLENVSSGSIGLMSEDLNVDSVAALRAQSQGFINIEETFGNMNLDFVSNDCRSDIRLFANTGSILDALATEDPNIIGNNITLLAPNGTIGTFTEDVDMNSNCNPIGGALFVLANGFINLTETEGDMLINLISNAGNADVQLVAAGSILDGQAGEAPNIYARGLSLFSANGTIGTAGQDLDIAMNFNNTGGVLSAVSPTGLINIDEVAGNMTLNRVETTNTITLRANQFILNGRADLQANAIGGNINLTSVNNAIGTPDNPIRVQSSTNTVVTSAPGGVNVIELP